MTEMTAMFSSHISRWAAPLGLLLFLLLFGGVLYVLLWRMILRSAGKRSEILKQVLNQYIKRPLLLAIILMASLIAVPYLNLPVWLLKVSIQALRLSFYISLAWLLTAGACLMEQFVLDRYDIRARDNLKARTIYTQVRVLKNVLIFIIVVVTFGIILMSFEQVRRLGFSILASAGIAGIILGFAAQRTIALLLSGIQIAITQPIRLDDVVIVENEWGWIEEITLTYVVVRIWDLRRLVVPITYFTEQPFQNWTRTSADILGSVFLYVDYTFPVAELREELNRIVSEDPRWDGKTCVLQVTDAGEHVIQLRALVSAQDSPTAWDLRCAVREKLISFVQSRYPEHLPRYRAELRHPHEGKAQTGG